MELGTRTGANDSVATAYSRTGRPTVSRKGLNEPADPPASRFKPILFLSFSLALAVYWCVQSGGVASGLFSAAPLIALSLGRFYGVRHPVPAPEVLVFIYPISAQLIFYWMDRARIQAYDEFLLAFDRNYGYAEMLVGKLARYEWVRQAFGWQYLSLMLALILLYLVLPEAARMKFIVSVSLAAVIIVPLYMLCPGAGPIYLLQCFPCAIPDLAHPHPTILHALLNTTPSGHVAWALLLFWFARRYCGRLCWILAGIYLAMTCITTLGLGEHYIIDLVLSVPFAAGIQALAYKQWRCAGISMLVVIVWLLMLRGPALAMPPAVAWILTAITMVPIPAVLRTT